MLGCCIEVTGSTAKITMDRVAEAFLIDPQRDRFAIPFGSEPAITVAGKTFVVILGIQ
jgi:hypothetical protein